jgi:quinolinate synthase
MFMRQYEENHADNVLSALEEMQYEIELDQRTSGGAKNSLVRMLSVDLRGLFD